jgi:hypothetical protein
MLRCRFVLAAALVLASAPAWADDTQNDQAKQLLTDGNKLFTEEKYDEALVKLNEAYALSNSPNVLLMVARTLVRLKRLPEAAEAYYAAEQDARRRLAESAKYQQTADTANAELAPLRSVLGVVRLRVHDAPADATLQVNGNPRPGPIKNGVDMPLYFEPGDVEIALAASGYEPVSKKLTVAQATETPLDLTMKEPGAVDADAPAEKPKAPPNWTLPATIAVGSVGLIGMGMFAGFGLSSKGIYDDLRQRCAPRCGAADLPDRDTGERNARIANGMLAVGIVGLVAGSALLTYHVISHRGRKDAAVVVGPNWIGARGSF